MSASSSSSGDTNPKGTVTETQGSQRLPRSGPSGLSVTQSGGKKDHKIPSSSTSPALLGTDQEHRNYGSTHATVSTAKSKSKRLSGEGEVEEVEEVGEDEGEVGNRKKTNTETTPLFPPLPAYGPVTPWWRFQCVVSRVTSGMLSLSFLGVIVVGSLVKSAPVIASKAIRRIKREKLDPSRPFHKIEKERARIREIELKIWKARQKDFSAEPGTGGKGARNKQLAGGEDKLLCDIGYYARRVGLEVEEFQVQTGDGFLIDLQHVFDPDDPPYYPGEEKRGGRRRYPVLLMHGLLQSAGAFCVNDDDSLAFYLCKSGFDVWLGNNRCGLNPAHTEFDYSDPRMWSWNIRQMGTFDLPALINHVLTRTSFKKLGLVCHSQGTAQTFVALTKQQFPDLGSKISVFCALAPAVYAGPLIDRVYFKFMRTVPASVFRVLFGIHAFIPFMMIMHSLLPGTIYGKLGYRVFSFLFGWSDTLWDRGLRNRFFQFAPVYVSAEHLRWWLDGFARHKCILTRKTIEQQALEEEQWESEEEGWESEDDSLSSSGPADRIEDAAWYDSRCPPMAFWVAGKDDLVDGVRLLRRFAKGREPHVDVIHAKVIEEYEHLDVIWAIDAVEKVFGEVKGVLWKCVEDGVKGQVVVPDGLSA